MIWECTVCTNHFDGPAPPDSCRSCGSPRQYFTAYHHYGLQPPVGRPDDVTERVERPSYAESAIQRATLFRFHAARHFHAEPGAFYRNFLETRRTFMASQRFAGRGFNSGFYFATTGSSAVAERLFYSDIDADLVAAEAHDVLVEFKNHGKDVVFLEATLSLDRIADLTDPIVLEYFLREGPARADIRPTGVPFELLRAITPWESGGSKHTDGIGHFASSHGWNAVRFPSVRALGAAWGIKNLTRMDILTKTAKDRRLALQEDVEDQLRNEACIVVFSGSILTRSVSQYAWTDVEGRRGMSKNPYFGVDSKALESVRLEYRKENALDPMKAAELGYLSDEEIAEEYKADVMWVSKKERI